MAIYFPSFIAENSQGVYISCLSHCCDTVPYKNNLRKGLFQLTVYEGMQEIMARKP